MAGWNYEPELSDEEAADVISDRWADALRPAISAAGVALDLRVAYYAPSLNKAISQAGDDLDYLPEDLGRLLIAWADQLGALPADTAQGYPTMPLRWIVDMMADHLALDRIALRPFVAAFLGEVDTYLRSSDSASRIAARSVVAEVLRRHQPHVVIAHSLGSVVCYEALWACIEQSVDLFITVGSPLGMRGVVFDRLDPPPMGNRGQRPPNVQHWVNVADPGDIVAIPRPFTRRFNPDSNYEEHIHPIDFHTARHYLTSTPTVDAILRHFGPPRSGPVG